MKFWNALYLQTLWDTNESKRSTNGYKRFSFECRWSHFDNFKNDRLTLLTHLWNFETRCISEPFEIQMKVREVQTGTNDSLSNAVGPISITLKMTDLPSWRNYKILKSLYLRILWGTNESKRGTNGYKRFSFECRWSHFDIFKIG